MRNVWNDFHCQNVIFAALAHLLGAVQSVVRLNCMLDSASENIWLFPFNKSPQQLKRGAPTRNWTYYFLCMFTGSQTTRFHKSGQVCQNVCLLRRPLRVWPMEISMSPKYCASQYCCSLHRSLRNCETGLKAVFQPASNFWASCSI